MPDSNPNSSQSGPERKQAKNGQRKMLILRGGKYNRKKKISQMSVDSAFIRRVQRTFIPLDEWPVGSMQWYVIGWGILRNQGEESHKVM